MRTSIIIVAVLLAAQGAQVAHAEDTFEAKASGARRIRAVDDIVWALTTACDKGDDVQQRQCRIIRDRRAKALVGDVLLVEADADAFDVGKWSAAKKSVPVTLSACIQCGGLTVDGKTWYVTGAAPRVEGGKLKTNPLYDNARQFSDEGSANAWLKTLKTVRVQMLVKVPDKRRWQVSGRDGMLLDIVGYRVVTPCDGNVVLANPPSGPDKADRKACVRGSSARSETTPTDGVNALTAIMVQDAMKPVVDAANACFEKYGVAGKAKLDITIAGDGTIDKYDQTGDFEGTPTGQCIDRAMRDVQFPHSKKPKTKIGYPIVLQ